MEILNYVPVMLYTTLDLFLVNMVYDVYFITKFSKRVYKTVFLFIAIFLIFINIMIPSTFLKDLFSLIIHTAYFIFCFKGNIFKKIKILFFTITLLNLILLSVTHFLEFLLNWNNNVIINNSVFLYLEKLISYILVFVIINLLSTKMKYRKIYNKNYILTYIILMFLNILVLISTFNFYISSDYSKNSFETLILIIISANFLTIIVTFSLFNLLQNHLLKMHETEIKALTSERMTEYYRNLAGNTEEIRKFRHDMRYHAQVIDTYLDQGQTLKARDYLKTNIGQLSYRNLIYIEGLPVVSAILSDIQAKCKQLNYRFEPEVYVNYIPMDDDDTSIIIGNILTNALEALKKDNTQDRFILFEIKAAAEVTVISCRNHYIGKLLPKGTLYRTTKSNASNHGYGLNTIQEKTAKYNGLMEITTEHQVFHIQIFLPNNYPQESGNPRKTTTINEETPNYES